MNVAELTHEDCRALVATLTEKQRRVLVTALPLFSAEAAALSLGCSTQNVTHHLGLVYEKLGVSRLHQAAVVATKAGLV